jgi:hypothetical protein
LIEIEDITQFLISAWDGHAWHGPSFSSLLEGVDSEKALAHPIPGRHSIWELVNHVAFWIEKVTESLEIENMPDPEGLYDWPPTGEGEEDWVYTKNALETAHKLLLDSVARFNPERLNEKVQGRDYTYLTMFNGIENHNLYHAGQIALLRPKVS